ncbi:MAG: hypothetical protein FJ146_15535 [Deltaproteobacteria bacterium]|nr:hypothetical protein [Deltaproteobacteria bacterium]
MLGRLTRMLGNYIMLVALAALPRLGLAKVASEKLSEPTPESSLETAIKEISGIAVVDDKIVLLPEGKAMFLSLNWQKNGKNREGVFGPIEHQVRRPLPAGIGESDLVGADLVGTRWLILDGTEFSIREVATADSSEVTKRTVAWDLIKPPADRGGEPTRVETAALRAQFRKNWMRSPGRKITGWAKREGSGKKNDGSTYLLATKIPGYPVLEMRCGAGDESSSCILTRRCFVEGADDLKPAAMAGIGYSTKTKLVYLGDSAQRKIHVLRYDSCFHIVKVGELKLSDKLKQLSNVYVDAGDRLWLTTRAPDDYLNGSVYYWQLKP